MFFLYNMYLKNFSTSFFNHHRLRNTTRYAVATSPFSGVPPMKLHSSAVVWSNRKKSPMLWSEDSTSTEPKNLWSLHHHNYPRTKNHIRDSTIETDLKRRIYINWLIGIKINSNESEKKESERTKAFFLRAVPNTQSSNDKKFESTNWFDEMKKCIFKQTKTN